jgi:hypothetical protein
MTDVSHPSPGWYPDPAQPGQLRAWDGRQWTSRVRPAQLQDEVAGPGATSVVAVKELVEDADDVAAPAASARAGGGIDTSPPSLDAPDLPFGAELGENMAEDPMRPRRARRRRDGTNALVGLLLALFVGVGLFEVVTGGTTTSGSPISGATSTPASAAPIGAAKKSTSGSSVGNSAASANSSAPESANATAAAGLGASSCSNQGRLHAGPLLGQLKSSGIPVVRTTGAASLGPPTVGAGGVPAGPASAVQAGPGLGSPCTWATFTDKRRPGTNELEVFGTAEGARQTAAAHGSSGLVDAIGPTVLILDPSLAQFRSEYVTRITRLVEGAKA